MFRRPLVSYDFEIPMFTCERYRFEPLTLKHLVADYAMIMATDADLDGKLAPPGVITGSAGYTLEDEVIELVWHTREWARRTSFAFAVVANDDNRALGAAYLAHSPKVGDDAIGLSVARRDQSDPDADTRLAREFVPG